MRKALLWLLVVGLFGTLPLWAQDEEDTYQLRVGNFFQETVPAVLVEEGNAGTIEAPPVGAFSDFQTFSTEDDFLDIYSGAVSIDGQGSYSLDPEAGHRYSVIYYVESDGSGQLAIIDETSLLPMPQEGLATVLLLHTGNIDIDFLDVAFASDEGLVIQPLVRDSRVEGRAENTASFVQLADGIALSGGQYTISLVDIETVIPIEVMLEADNSYLLLIHEDLQLTPR